MSFSTETGTGAGARVTAGFSSAFGEARDAALFSAPGRTELGGNHTDHQRGRVLAAAVGLGIHACAAPRDDGRVRFLSEGWLPLEIDISDSAAREDERGTTAALIRGTAAFIRARGIAVGGFDAYALSEIPPGAGLSSSAACEVLLGRIMNSFYCGGELDAVTIARLAQRVENEYFGKPCGLMDQMACSLGGALAMDFAEPQSPGVTRLPFDPEARGYALCIINTGASHADLTDEYAAVPREMGSVAAFFGKAALREVDEAEFSASLPALRRAAGDRAVLRAMHFFAEDARVARQTGALLRGDFETFLSLVRESGRSSWELLQNISPAGAAAEQPMALALALGEKYLGGRGACRVHGGGFAGAVQAYVPTDALEGFTARMDAVFGEGSCREIRVLR